MRGRKPNVREVENGLAKLPKPPAWLGPEAKAEWRRVAPELEARRCLKAAELATLENYCDQAGEVRRCRRIIREEGETVPGKVGPIRHPLYGVMAAALGESRRLAEALGLTPTSRHKTPSAEAAEDDDFSQMIR